MFEQLKTGPEDWNQFFTGSKPLLKSQLAVRLFCSTCYMGVMLASLLLPRRHAAGWVIPLLEIGIFAGLLIFTGIRFTNFVETKRQSLAKLSPEDQKPYLDAASARVRQVYYAVSGVGVAAAIAGIWTSR